MNWNRISPRAIAAGALCLCAGLAQLHAQDSEPPPATAAAPTPAPADAAAPDEKVAIALFEDALQAILKHSMKAEPAAEVIRKTSQGLLADLGGDFPDLPVIPPDADEPTVRSAFVEQLRFLAAYPGQRFTMPELAERALAAYCRSVDRYSRYFSRADYNNFALTRKSSGSGVGMTLQEFNGDFFCYPFPGGSAETAGVRAGDMLLAVDGKPIKGKSLLSLAGLIRGTPGTEVVLKITRTYGRSTNITLQREAQSVPAVVVEEGYSGLVFKVRKITPQTVAEMKEALGRAGGASNLTLDLRGCPGGEATAARDLAALFLPRDSTVFHEEVMGQRTAFKNEQEPAFSPSQIVILQDAGTASAAEILIAALIENMPSRAVSQGEKSFGKGVIQEQVRLAGGGYLEITTGRVYSPQGHSWDGTGLQPSLTNGGRIFAADAPKMGENGGKNGTPATETAPTADAGESLIDGEIPIQVIGRKGPGGAQ